MDFVLVQVLTGTVCCAKCADLVVAEIVFVLCMSGCMFELASFKFSIIFICALFLSVSELRLNNFRLLVYKE